MAIPRIKVWNDEILFPADLNAEFDNTNALAVPNPFDAAINGGGQDITNLDNIALNSTTFANVGAAPAVTGQLQRNGGVLMLHDGTAVRVNQCLESTGASGIISDTAIETSLYALALFGGALGTSRQVETKIMLRVGLLNGAGVQIVCYYGGSQGASIGLANNSGVTADFTLCPLTVTLSGNQATNAQILMAECHVTQIVNNLADAFVSLSPVVMHGGGTAIDSTIAQAFQINVLFSAADPANRCDYTSVKTMLIG